jgi:hypothetical protein
MGAVLAAPHFNFRGVDGMMPLAYTFRIRGDAGGGIMRHISTFTGLALTLTASVTAQAQQTDAAREAMLARASNTFYCRLRQADVQRGFCQRYGPRLRKGHVGR